MNVKILDISEKLIDGYKVLVQVDSSQFIAEWDGDKPEENENYNVEIDIDDEFIWNTNIAYSDENANAIIQNDEAFKVIAKLDYNSEDNLATLNVYDSIVLIDIEGIEQDIANEWVEMQCTSIKLFNTNL
ncbi:hypothetical protein JOY42_25830 [Bacillus tropicus]|uniref:hypothetical protein n=1 Tax=Bacillus cereus group TaxID=86661 RepID=UPI0022E2E6A3|nr:MULTISPECIES: hypothetical protein [unclassified Bacillus cereus group]MDA1564068.1 hypothetical protein [Bacillus cereus group sp. TH243-1LC]MDA1657944.1 hypothetical protein [Bacillus cereus group sp. TH150LC]MDA1860959.1 hypothetical protein [Bacillus cereus group sp. BY122LC]